MWGGSCAWYILKAMFVGALRGSAVFFGTEFLCLCVGLQCLGLTVNRDGRGVIPCGNHVRDLLRWLRYFGHTPAECKFTRIKSGRELECITRICHKCIGLIIGFDTICAAITEVGNLWP